MRRKKGEGSIFQRGNGTWEAKIKVNGRQKCFYGKTEKEARRKLDEFKKRIAQGQKLGKSISYAELLDIWLERKKKEIKPQSYDRLEMTVRVHIKPEVGFYTIGKLDAEILQEDIIDKKVKLLAYESVKKIYDALNASLRFAQSTGHIIHNPVDLLVLPIQASGMYKKKTKESSLEIFTEDEISRFVKATQDTYSNGNPVYRNAQIFTLMLNTGIRAGEAIALLWENYSPTDRTLTINSTMARVKNSAGKVQNIRQNSAKTRNSERMLKLNTNAINAIPNKAESNYIFCTKDGNSLTIRNLQTLLDRILLRAEIPHKSTHVFRHTFASRLFEKGVDVRIVSELLGHASVATTYNTYITLIQKQKAKAMEAIEDMY